MSTLNKIRRLVGGKARRSKEIPICVFSHHKVGTVLCLDVFDQLAAKMGWSFASMPGKHTELPEDADVVVFQHSLIEVERLDQPFLGVHFVRDPRDVIVSGYLFHCRTDEEWCVNTDLRTDPPIKHPRVPLSQEHRSEEWKAAYLRSLQGRSYQQNLLDRTTHDGLFFEMDHYGAWTLESLDAWAYGSRKEILEVRFEDISHDFDRLFTRIFEHLGFAGRALDDAMAVARRFDLSRKSRQEIDDMKHVTSRESTRWRSYFDEAHVATFMERHASLLDKLGYDE